MAAGLFAASTEEDSCSAEVYSWIVSTRLTDWEFAARQQRPAQMTKGMEISAVSRETFAVVRKGGFALGGRRGPGRGRRPVKRSHHKLQVECLLTDSRVVIIQHEDNHEQRPRKGAAHGSADR